MAALAYAVVSLLLYATCFGTHHPGADGYYGWIYARSLAYDGDLDFNNDYALCGDPWEMGWTTPTHHRANPFYIGPAVFWTPAIWVLKHFVHGDPKVVGGCLGPVPTLVLTMSSIAGAVLVLATSALLRRFVGARTAATASLLATLGGYAIYMTALLPSYSHIYDAMCVALYLYVIVQLREKGPSLGRLAVAGVFLGLAFLQRTTSGVFCVVAIGALLRLTPAAALRTSIRSLAVIGVFAALVGVVPLLVANKIIIGHATLIAHGPYIIWPAHAHPLLLLFDERGGLFAGAPVMWLGVPGLVLLLLRKKDARWLAWPLVLCAAFEIYVASSALDWQGARRVLNLTPLGALCIALTVERAGRWVWARPERVVVAGAVAAVTTVAWPNAGVVAGFARNKIAWDRPLTASERYGEGQKQELAAIEEHVGSLSVLPAEWVFALRYHLPPVTFGWAAHPEWLNRDYHTLKYTRADFPFASPETRQLVRGVRFDDATGSACLTGSTATAVFSLGWPVTTRVRLIYDATEEDTLSARSRSFLGVTTAWGAVSLHPGKNRRVIFRVPRGGLDSGINQVELERTNLTEGLCLQAIEFADDTRYPAVPEANASAPLHLWHAGTYQTEPGAAPSVAVGHMGAAEWVLEVHETPNQQLATYIRNPGEYTSPAVLDTRGFHPGVAAVDTNGTVVEAHQGTPSVGALLSRVGYVVVTGTRVAVTWGSPSQYGFGFRPAIAAFAGRVVEIDMVDLIGSALVVRTGLHGGGTVAWDAALPLGTPGINPSVAANDMLVVEAHQQQAGSGPLWLRVGRFRPDGAIGWHEPRQYGEGVFPSIALFGKTIVEVHQIRDDSEPLWMKVGTIGDDGLVSWVWSSEYDHGGHPALGLDSITGKGVAVQQGGIGQSALLERAVDVY